MGFKDRFSRFAGLDTGADEVYPDAAALREEPIPTPMQTAPGGGFAGNMGMGMPAGMGMSGSMAIKVECPTSFSEASRIADHLLNNYTVMLNLEQTDPQVARRLVDFLSGVAYSRGGQLQKVATRTFCITPSDVDVTGSKYHAPQKSIPQDDNFGNL